MLDESLVREYWNQVLKKVHQLGISDTTEASEAVATYRRILDERQVGEVTYNYPTGLIARAVVQLREEGFEHFADRTPQSIA